MRGFTLIEFIIYIGIVAVILVVALNFGWEIIYGNTKSQAIREVQQNSRLAMAKITESILAASEIDTPLPGDSVSELELKMQNAGLDPTVFEVDDNVLTIKQGANGPYQLTNNRVRVTSLQFTNVSYEAAPGTIRVEMIIEHINPNNLSQYEASLSTTKTISLRK